MLNGPRVSEFALMLVGLLGFYMYELFWWGSMVEQCLPMDGLHGGLLFTLSLSLGCRGSLA